MHDDLTPIDTHCWTYTQCTRTQSRSFHHTDRGAFSSHRQSSEGVHFITPTELRPNSQVFAPPSTSDTIVLQMAKRHQKASCSCSNVFENAQPNNQTRLPYNCRMTADLKPSFTIWSSRMTLRKPPRRTPLKSRFRVWNPLFTEGSHTVKIRGGASDTSCVLALSFSRDVSSRCGSHFVACTVDDKNAAHLKATKCRWR